MTYVRRAAIYLTANVTTRANTTAAHTPTTAVLNTGDCPERIPRARPARPVREAATERAGPRFRRGRIAGAPDLRFELEQLVQAEFDALLGALLAGAGDHRSGRRFAERDQFAYVVGTRQVVAAVALVDVVEVGRSGNVLEYGHRDLLRIVDRFEAPPGLSVFEPVALHPLVRDRHGADRQEVPSDRPQCI